MTNYQFKVILGLLLVICKRLLRPDECNDIENIKMFNNTLEIYERIDENE